MAGEIDLAAKRVPLSPFISEEARAALSAPRPVVLDTASQPKLDDVEGWRTYIRNTNQFMEQMQQMLLPLLDVTVEWTTLNGVRVAWVRPRKPRPEFAGRVLMNIHGGAFILGEGSVVEAAVAAHMGGVDVLAVDYRLPPDHPFPANLEDTIGAYRALLDTYGAGNIAIFGTSAGGTYTLTTILKARELGLPLPAAAGICTPAVELSGRWGYSGDTLVTNDGLDVLSGSTPEEGATSDGGATALFVGGADVEDPLVSPIYGDYAKGFSPSYLLSGTRDMLLSCTVLIHRKLHRAGVPCELHVFESMQHGFQMNVQLPEAREAVSDMLRFFRERMDAAKDRSGHGE